MVGLLSFIVVVDDKGRIYFPSEVRRRLGLRKGSRLRASIEDNKLILTAEEKGVKIVKRGRPWGGEAFPCAGEVLVS